MENNAQTVAAVIVKAALEHGYIEPTMATIEELADVEKALFLKMFSALETHRERTGRSDLTVEEISSMFAYVYAKGAEAVTHYVNRQKQEFDTLGLFDGKIPFCSDDRLIEHLKTLDAAAVLGGVFADWAKENRNTPDFNAVLSLFEALKWVFRISADISIRFAEQKH